VSLCITHSKNFVLFLGQLKRISKPVQEKFDSDWLFLLILGIIVALISFGLDFSIDKCQQGI
jgi:chloride channel 2